MIENNYLCTTPKMTGAGARRVGTSESTFPRLKSSYEKSYPIVIIMIPKKLVIDGWLMYLLMKLAA